MKYGFIGAGNIAEAIIKGMIKAKVAPNSSFYIFEVNEQRRLFMEENLQINTCVSNEELAALCDVVFLTVKPRVVNAVLREISDVAKTRRPLIISIAAGVELATMENQLGFASSIARVMPNTNAAIGESMSLICVNAHVSDKQFTVIENCFSAIGKTHSTTEDAMPILTALCGCAPAFAYLFIESLAKAAHKHGIDKKTAVSLAIQTVLGSAGLLEQSQNHISSQIDAVCSPGGMTIKGICSLDENGFQSIVLKAIEAAMN